MKTYEKAYELDGQTARILKFVAAARSKNDYRKFFNIIHIEDGKAVATDGIRLHISELPISNDKPVLDDCDYSVLHEEKKKIVIAKIDDAGFPKWKNIIPKGKIDQSLKFYTQSKAHISQEYAALLVKGGEFAAINIKYLEPLVGEAWTVNIRKHPKHNKDEFMYKMYPVEFISARSRAYIMTIMIQE